MLYLQFPKYFGGHGGKASISFKGGWTKQQSCGSCSAERGNVDYILQQEKKQ